MSQDNKDDCFAITNVFINECIVLCVCFFLLTGNLSDFQVQRQDSDFPVGKIRLKASPRRNSYSDSRSFQSAQTSSSFRDVISTWWRNNGVTERVSVYIFKRIEIPQQLPVRLSNSSAE